MCGEGISLFCVLCGPRDSKPTSSTSRDDGNLTIFPIKEFEGGRCFFKEHSPLGMSDKNSKVITICIRDDLEVA